MVSNTITSVGNFWSSFFSIFNHRGNFKATWKMAWNHNTWFMLSAQPFKWYSVCIIQILTTHQTSKVCVFWYFNIKFYLTKFKLWKILLLKMKFSLCDLQNTLKILIKNCYWWFRHLFRGTALPQQHMSTH